MAMLELIRINLINLICCFYFIVCLDSKPPPYAPPPYPGLADPSAQPQYPPPGQGYGWSQPPTSFPGQHQQPYAGAPLVTHPPALGGAASDKPAGYPVQPGYPGQPPQQPGYPAQPGYPGYPGYQQGYQGYQGYQPGPMTTQTSSVTVVVCNCVVFVDLVVVCLLCFACLNMTLHRDFSGLGIFQAKLKFMSKLHIAFNFYYM